METAYLGTSNQNNWNIMVSQQNEFTTELGNTKAFIYLRLSEYCWITPSTSSRGLFNNIHWILSFRPHIFFLQHLQYRSKQYSRQSSYLVVFSRAITSARRITRQEGRGGGGGVKNSTEEYFWHFFPESYGDRSVKSGQRKRQSCYSFHKDVAS